MTTHDPRALRDAFGSFMTGITVVTACDSTGAPVGFTANSFTSVSLEPPLLLVCPAKTLSSYPAFVQASHFAVSILAEDQQDISNIFARSGADRFQNVPHRLDAMGLPLIDGAIAQFSCTTHQVIDAGDHCMLVGRVDRFLHQGGAGLGYAGGRYFSLGLERGALQATRRQVVFGAIVESAGHVLLESTKEGYRPPRIIRTGHAQLRKDLAADLAARGLPVDLGAVYSVFDDSETHSAYLLATAAVLRDLPGIDALPIRDLARARYASSAIADMMQRFALEARHRDFSLYLGDAERGEIHRPSDGS